MQVLSKDPPLLSRQVAISFALKVVLNRIYRLFARPLEAGRPVIRSWVEVTEGMYGPLFDAAQLRVFPFSFGMSRQLAFVRSLARRRLRWSLDGLPYRWSDAVAALWPWGARHLRLARAEWRAYDRYAQVLLAAGVREVHTSDDFEVGAVAAGDRLLAAGARYVNTAHGIGLHCPEVSYSLFLYMNDHCARFYRQAGNPMALRKRESPNARLPFTQESVATLPELALIVVHQNFEHYHLPCEAASQRAVLAAMMRVAQELGMVAAIKLHPNMPLKGIAAQLPQGMQVLSRWDDARRWRPVFLTFYSTAFYEIREVAPVLVYQGPTYTPSVYLDGDFETFDEHNLGRQVAPLRDHAAWAALVARQCQDSGQGLQEEVSA